MKSRAKYIAQLYKTGVFWKILGLVITVVTTVSYLRDEFFKDGGNWKWKIISIIREISLPIWTIIILSFLLAWIFESSFRLFKKQDSSIAELKKIDRWDVENLLCGHFLGNDFIYSGDWPRRCKFFDSKLEIEQLRNNFTEISVPAPKNSNARICLKYMNGLEPTSRIIFYILGPDGASIEIENIYQEVNVWLNDQAKFSLKISYGDDYSMHENASLRITATGWFK